MLHHKLRAAGGVLQSITKISHVTASSSTITVMSDVQADDLLIFSDVAEGDSVPSAVTPSGFTQISTITGSGMRWSIFYKIANGTESGTVLTGMNDDSERKRLILFRGNKSISSVTTGSLVSQQDDGYESISTTITSSGGTTPFIIIALYGSDINTECIPPNYTFTGETADETIGYATNTSVVSAIKYKIKNRGDTSNNVGIGITNDDCVYGLGIIGFYLELE